MKKTSLQDHKESVQFQASKRMWNKTIITFFQKIGFVLTNANLYILAYRQGNVFILIGVYIDDFLLGS